ncbi:hypothetical protein, partial [Paenirhodobacter populi]
MADVPQSYAANCIAPVKICSCYKGERSNECDHGRQHQALDGERKTALVIEIIRGKTTVAEASRSFDLSPSEIEGWIDDAKRGMENSLRANPLDIRGQYEKQLKDLQEAYGEAMLELRARENTGPCWNEPLERHRSEPNGECGRQMIQSIQQGLLAEGIKVPLNRPCVWFGVPRRTVYDRPAKAAPKVDPRFAEPIKAIEQEPSFGYRTVAWLPGFNKNTVQRVFQLKGWQVRKRPVGMRPRIEAIPSVATAPNAGRPT